MGENKIRGLLPDDDRFFSVDAVSKLRKAQEEIHYLLNHNYPMKSTTTFVGNHHQLTVRQIIALTRATSSGWSIENRKLKELKPSDIHGRTVHIDGFNLIITIEVALSDGMLFRGMDGCVRDLAELRGTYRLIPQTVQAIEIVRESLEELGAEGVVFYLDQPVSNSGRLKTAIMESDWRIDLDVQIVRNPDAVLKEMSNVVTGDAIILDECESWFNLVGYMLKKDKFQKLTRIINLN